MSQNNEVANNDLVKDNTEADGLQPSTTHKMSIAITIGGTIGLIGLVILLYGLFGGADYSKSDGININLWWGLVMVIFGVIMAGGNFLAIRAKANR